MWGEGLKSSAVMSYERLPEETRKGFEIVFEDDRFEPKSAISSFRHLVDEKLVKGIIVFGSNSALAISPLAEKEEIPLIVLGLSPKTYQGRKWVVQHWIQVKPLVDKIIEIAKDKNSNALTVITSEHESFASIQKELLESAPKNGIKVSKAETVPLDHKDLSYLVPKLLKENNSTIAVCLLPEQNKSFASAALKAKLKLDMIGCNGLDTPNLSEDEESFFKGVSYPAVKFTSEFLELFKKKNPGKDWIGAGNIFDSVKIFADAIKDPAQRNEITIDYIKKSQINSFPFGSYEFNHEGYFEVPLTVKNR